MKKFNISKRDLYFLIFLTVLVLIIIIASIIISTQKSQSGDLSTTSPTTSPSPTLSPTPTISTNVPSPTPTQGVGGFDSDIYELPRKRAVSLNPYIRYEQMLVGSGITTVSEVINLEKTYLIGQTTSSDGDFSAKDGSDIFIAVVDGDGTLVSTRTLNEHGEDIAISAKPIPKLSGGEENGILIVSQNSEQTDNIIISKVLENSLTSTSMKIAVGDNACVNKVVGGNEGITILATSDKGITVMFINRNLTVEWSKNISGFQGKDMLVYGGKVLVLANDSDSKEGYSSLKLLTVFTSGEESRLTDTFANHIGEGKEIIPTRDGGFLISYLSKQDKGYCYAIMKLDKKMNVIFTHITDTPLPTDIKILEIQLQVEDNKTSSCFELFITTKSGTTFEKITSSGELTEKSTAFLNGERLMTIAKEDGGYVITATANDETSLIIMDESFLQTFKTVYDLNHPIKTITLPSGDMAIYFIGGQIINPNIP